MTPFAVIARGHADGIVDLSVGTPVDAVPAAVREALDAASNAPGYPMTAGTDALRQSVLRWARRVLHANVEMALPTIGSKEFVAALPLLLALGPSDTVAIPRLAYPTYEVGARLVGAKVVRAESPQELEAAGATLVWLNSPANPTGRVLDDAMLRDVVAWGRERSALIVNDECYLELGDGGRAATSILDPAVCGESHRGVLAVHSLSKRSNMAGYRVGLVLGDPDIVTGLIAARRHLGAMVPSPIQAAAVAAYDDERHVVEARSVYARRRSSIVSGLTAAGFRIDHSSAGLYVWATRDEPCWATVGWLADRGILVAPGDFYGPEGSRHVRVALTATDERTDAAVRRLHPDA